MDELGLHELAAPRRRRMASTASSRAAHPKPIAPQMSTSDEPSTR